MAIQTYINHTSNVYSCADRSIIIWLIYNNILTIFAYTSLNPNIYCYSSYFLFANILICLQTFQNQKFYDYRISSIFDQTQILIWEQQRDLVVDVVPTWRDTLGNVNFIDRFRPALKFCDGFSTSNCTDRKKIAVENRPRMESEKGKTEYIPLVKSDKSTPSTPPRRPTMASVIFFKFIRPCMAEMLGTMTFVFVGVCSVSLGNYAGFTHGFILFVNVAATATVR